MNEPKVGEVYIYRSDDSMRLKGSYFVITAVSDDTVFAYSKVDDSDYSNTRWWDLSHFVELQELKFFEKASKLEQALYDLKVEVDI